MKFKVNICRYCYTTDQKKSRRKLKAVPVSQRIWTPRAIGPQSKSANRYGSPPPPRPYPLADVDPPSQIWAPYQTFLSSIVCIIFGN